MKRETYYLQSAAIQRASSLMGAGHRVNFYGDVRDGKSARWRHPVEIEHHYAGWSDHTDTPEKEFIEFLQNSVDVGDEQP